MKKLLTSLALAGLVTAATAFGASAVEPGRARYSVPLKKLDEALNCRSLRESRVAQPVLLVHGTFADDEVNWSWNYWKTLFNDGFDVCWVKLPRAAMGDAQISAEYVARSIEVMHKIYGGKVDVIGHSQGGIVQRWAIKWFWPGKFVDDYVALAAPNHGTVTSDASMVSGRCFASCWQMRTNSRFLRALNRDDETPKSASYTSIYTETDQLVQPSTSPKLRGAVNIKIQDVCPGRTVDHIAIVGDGAVYDLVVDALTHPGGTDLERMPADLCLQAGSEGATPDPITKFPDYDQGVWTDREPALKPYAR